MNEDLNAIEERVGILERELTSIKQVLQQIRNVPGRETVISSLQKNQFEQLKTLLESNAWPFAINPNLICDITSEQDKEDRAEGILDIIIDVHMEGMKFLDFGCGEGHVISRSKLQNTQLSIGYDIKESPRWAEFSSEKTKFTTNWSEVVENGPYNVILIYDVIDHILNDDPVDVLKRLRPLLVAGGKVFVRCHPFTSRHATHLYHKINKAYIHLVFNDEELQLLDATPEQKTMKIVHPVITYNDMFAKSGFKLANNPQIQREPVEPFFVNTPLIANRIKANWINSHEHALRSGTAFPFVQLEQQFADYILL